jgi:hypothetical protein
MDRFAIGALSKRTGCNIETIRYYERAGLLPTPGRSPGGYRLYGTDHLKRLAFVRRARALGFSIDEVRAEHLVVDVGAAVAQDLVEVVPPLTSLGRTPTLNKAGGPEDGPRKG